MVVALLDRSIDCGRRLARSIDRSWSSPCSIDRFSLRCFTNTQHLLSGLVNLKHNGTPICGVNCHRGTEVTQAAPGSDSVRLYLIAISIFFDGKKGEHAYTMPTFWIGKSQTQRDPNMWSKLPPKSEPGATRVTQPPKGRVYCPH